MRFTKMENNFKKHIRPHLFRKFIVQCATLPHIFTDSQSLSASSFKIPKFNSQNFLQGRSERSSIYIRYPKIVNIP